MTWLTLHAAIFAVACVLVAWTFPSDARFAFLLGIVLMAAWCCTAPLDRLEEPR